MGIDPTKRAPPPLNPLPPGRKFSMKLHVVAGKIGDVVRCIFKGMNDLIVNTDGFYYLIKFAGSAVVLTSYVTKSYHKLAGLGTALGDTDEIIELFGIVECLCEVSRGDHKKDNLPCLIARISIFAVNILGIFSLLDQVKLIDLGKIAKNMGSIPILKFVTKISLCTVIQGGLVVFYAALGAESIIRIVKAEDLHGRIQAIFQLAQCLTEVTLKVFILAGGTCVPVIAVFTMVSAGLGITTFLHRKSIEQGRLVA